MATYLVWSGAVGLNNGGGGTVWDDAYTTLAAALAAATSGSDVILIHKVYSDSATGAMLASANCAIICVDKDASNAPAIMGKDYWIFSDANTTNTFGGGYRVYMYGLTFKIGGGSGRALIIGWDNAHFVLEECLLWCANTSNTTSIVLGSQDGQTFIRGRNLRWSTAQVDQNLRIAAKVELVDGGIHATSTTPNVLLQFTNNDPGGATFDAWGVDLSIMGSGTMVGASSTHAGVAKFWACKLGLGFTALGAQSSPNRAGAEVYLYDCAVGNTHGFFGYYDAMGSVSTDAGVFLTAGAAGVSWRITTTTYCDFFTPFQTPWIDFYNTGKSSITPYLEILRSTGGTAVAYKDDEVWSSWMAKTTSESALASQYDDGQTLTAKVAGTAPVDQAAGVGAGSWTGGSGTPWSGKLDSGTSFMPQEVGHIRARVTVGKASVSNLYLNPQILGT